MNETGFNIAGLDRLDNTEPMIRKAFQEYSQGLKKDRLLAISTLRTRLDMIVASMPSTVTPAQMFARYVEEMELVAARASVGGMPGIPCGYGRINDCTGGWQEGLHFIIGWSSVGKTCVLTKGLIAAMYAGFRWRLFSADMSGRLMMSRFASTMHGIPLIRFAKCDLTPDELELYRKTARTLAEHGCCIDDEAKSMEAIAMTAVRDHDEYDLIAIDTLQSVQHYSSAPFYERACQTAMLLKGLTKQLHKPVVITAQASEPPKAKDNDRDEVPAPPSSNNIEGARRFTHEASTCVVVYRSNYQREVSDEAKVPARLILDKNQGGPKCNLRVDWDPEMCTYTDPKEIEQAGLW